MSDVNIVKHGEIFDGGFGGFFQYVVIISGIVPDSDLIGESQQEIVALIHVCNQTSKQPEFCSLSIDRTWFYCGLNTHKCFYIKE